MNSRNQIRARGLRAALLAGAGSTLLVTAIPVRAQDMGAETATKLAQVPPTPEELAAAQAGTTLTARPAPPPPPPITGEGARGQVTRKFDYTHLGNVGAEVTAKLVTEALAREVPALRSQLVR